MGDTPYAARALDKNYTELDQCVLEDAQSFAPPLDGKSQSLQCRPEDNSNETLTSQGILPDLTLSGVESSPKDNTSNKDQTSSNVEASNLRQDTDAVEAQSKPPRTTQEILDDPNTPQEEKIGKIIELSLLGENKFVGADGRTYDIVIESKGKNKTLISVHTKDEDGDSHVVLRAGLDGKGNLIHQHDDQGREVPYTGTWASRHLKDSPLVQGPEKTAVKLENAGEQIKDAPVAVDKPSPNLSTSQELLKAHPELKPLSASEEKILRNDLGALDKKQAHDSQALETKRNQLYDDSARLTGDLAAVGIKNFSNQKELIQQLKAVQPREKAVQLANRIDALSKDNGEVVKLEAQVQRQATRLKETQDKIGFNEGLAAIDKLPAEKRNEIYKSFDSVLNSGDKSQITGLTKKERVEIVRNLSSQIAHPEYIKQGDKNTCAISSTEYVMAKDHPEIYVRTTAQLATHGKVDGVTGADIDGKSIHTDDGDHTRSLASKIFQTGVAGLWAAEKGGRYENHNPKDAPPVTAGTKPKPEDDTGERFIKDGQVSDFPGVTNSDQVKLINKLTGDNYQTEKLYATSSELLQKQLEAEAKTYGYPIKVGFSWVDLNGKDQAHEVTIVGIDTSTTPAKVLYEDTARDRGKPQELDMKKFYHLAVEGPFTHKIGDQSLMVIGAAGPNGERAEPYVQVIHRAKAGNH